MNTKELVSHIHDIRGLIGECYEDKEPLTKDQKDSKEVFIRYCNEIETALTKYAKYNSSEEELGIDLDVLINALKNCIWLENVYGEIVGLKCYLICQPKGWILRIPDGYVFPKDHLKTWWLFEELSEEQKSRMNAMFKNWKEK